MSKRKFGFEGFGINRQKTYNFDRSQAPQRLYVPPSSRAGGSHDNYEDTDLDNIDYDAANEEISNEDVNGGGRDDEVDPLDAFMEGIHEEMKTAPAKAKDKVDKYRDDEEDDPMESYLRAKKDIGLTLASDALHAGYNSDEEVYAAAKAVDNGMLEYDSDDNPILLDRKKIQPIPPLDHSSIDYVPYNKDFYEEKPSISVVPNKPSSCSFPLFKCTYPDALISIDPVVLKFQFVPKKLSSCSFQLSNKSDKHVAFRVKTSNLKKYTVQPKNGIVLPGSQSIVQLQCKLRKNIPQTCLAKTCFLSKVQ